MRTWIKTAATGGLAALLVACSTAPQRPAPGPQPGQQPEQPVPTQPVPPPPPPPLLRYEPAAWSTLPGWSRDDIRAAWPALLTSCRSTRLAAAWNEFCNAARATDAADAAAQRRLLETRLRPYRLITESQDGKLTRRDRGLITGYYEPLLKGSRTRGGIFQTPLYAVPDDLVTIDLGDQYPALKGERIRGRLQGKRVTPYPDRAQLADGKLLTGKELVYIDNPVDAFFLQIQGSGRVQLPDGSMVRLAFADVNGQPYRAIGRYLVEKGELTNEQVASLNMRRWLAEHPDRQKEVFNYNPSVVFFREEKLGDPKQGPNGALGLPLTAGRSLAVDPRQLPLGAPIFLATAHPLTGEPLQRLMFGQDTGGAIRGALRADFFWGLGQEAGTVAGSMRHDGSMWLLWPADQPLPVPAN
jgi:membrane-bound lytic murein transglycosylase A